MPGNIQPQGATSRITGMYSDDDGTEFSGPQVTDTSLWVQNESVILEFQKLFRSERKTGPERVRPDNGG